MMKRIYTLEKRSNIPIVPADPGVLWNIDPFRGPATHTKNSLEKINVSFG